MVSGGSVPAWRADVVGAANFKGAVGATLGSAAPYLAGRWITLPMGPTVNHYYVVGTKEKGREKWGKFLGRDVMVYRRIVYYELRKLTKGPIAIIPPPLHVEVELSFPTKAKNDLDNRMKGLLDALRIAGLFKDDSEIDELYIRRGPIIRDDQFFGGQCRVKVTTIDKGEAS